LLPALPRCCMCNNNHETAGVSRGIMAKKQLAYQLEK